MSPNSKNLLLAVFVLCCVISEIYCDENMAGDSELSEGRTFGHHFLKRISFAIIPAAFVVGVITTLLAALTVVSLKSVGIGTILLILALGQLLARNLPLAQQYSQPIPLVYSRAQPQIQTNPVWLEKDW